MVEHALDGLPTLAQLAAQHGLTEEELSSLLAQNELPPELAEALLHLGTVEFRSLARWGQKAEYSRAVQAAITRRANGPRRP